MIEAALMGLGLAIVGFCLGWVAEEVRTTWKKSRKAGKGYGSREIGG